MKEIYQVLSAMMGQERRLSHIANNLANVNTTGYKRDQGVFEDIMKSAAAAADPTSSDHVAVAAYGHDTTNFSSGSAIRSGGSYDFMIEGEGFFEVEGQPGGNRLLTRAGDFRLNPEGELTTTDGKRVLDDSGSPIKFQTEDTSIEVAPDGTIKAGTRDVGKLRVVEVTDKSKLVKQGNNLFAAPPNLATTNGAKGVVRHGFLEGSNTNAIEEMIRMIETQRAFEIQQKAIKTVDDLLGERIGQVLNG